MGNQDRNMMQGRNNILLVHPTTGEPTHFTLREFENRDGLAMVHSATLVALEAVRADLCAFTHEEVWLIITKYGAVRTPADNELLGAKYGWTDEGGKVSRDSTHLAEYGGIAGDLVAVVVRTRERIAQVSLGRICRRYFDWVKDDYPDGHVHADKRGVIEPEGDPT